MATKARRTWLGRRAKASGSSPLKEKAGKNHKGPRAAAGAFSLHGGTGGSPVVTGHPLAAAGHDVLELAADEVAEAVVDRAQQSERDEDPRLGVRVALGDDPARCL